MHLTHEDISKLDRIKRLNIINSIAGIRPANLIGTTKDNVSNLAIFSSVMHLGSFPALMGFILRPQGEVKRNTYDNIKANGVFTINHVPIEKVCNAHATSAKFAEEDSEFKHCDFKEQWLDGFNAPFVQESILKIGLSFEQEIPIEINKTSLIIGRVEHLVIDENVISEEGYIDLESINSTGVAGLNSYYQLKKLEAFPYARVKGS
jgi:flavin reductase (DIM6/NTAB) family NADH-FMN oxidoreductase RutF